MVYEGPWQILFDYSTDKKLMGVTNCVLNKEKLQKLKKIFFQL